MDYRGVNALKRARIKDGLIPRSKEKSGHKKPSNLLGSDVLSGGVKPYLVTPTGVEPVLPP